MKNRQNQRYKEHLHLNADKQVIAAEGEQKASKSLRAARLLFAYKITRSVGQSFHGKVKLFMRVFLFGTFSGLIDIIKYLS